MWVAKGSRITVKERPGEGVEFIWDANTGGDLCLSYVSLTGRGHILVYTITFQAYTITFQARPGLIDHRS